MNLKLGMLNINVAAILPVVLLSLFNPPEYVGGMLFCALLHECGHLVALKAVGGTVHGINIMPLGADIKIGGRLRSYGADALVYASGAVANIMGAVCAYIAYLYVPLTEVMFLIFFNLFYAFFNMLHIRCLDGGGFAEALLLRRYDVEKVWKVVEKVSFLFVILLFLVSLWVIYKSGNNFSLLFLVIYLFINL